MNTDRSLHLDPLPQPVPGVTPRRFQGAANTKPLPEPTPEVKSPSEPPDATPHDRLFDAYYHFALSRS